MNFGFVQSLIVKMKNIFKITPSRYHRYEKKNTTINKVKVSAKAKQFFHYSISAVVVENFNFNKDKSRFHVFDKLTEYLFHLLRDYSQTLVRGPVAKKGVLKSFHWEA